MRWISVEISGFRPDVVRLDRDGLAAKTDKFTGEIEIVLPVSVGTFVAFEDLLAEVRAPSSQTAAEIAEAVQKAFRVEQQRDLDNDAAYGIEQLAIIGWTTVLTAKSNPSPGLLALRSLRDLLARWSAGQDERSVGEAAPTTIPVVYTDNVFARLLDAFETLAVVASESMQPQTMAEFVRTFAVMFDRLPAAQQPRAEDVLLRSLSALGEHVLTAELNVALSELIHALDAAGRYETAAHIRAAQDSLAASVGLLGSRATRCAQQKVTPG